MNNMCYYYGCQEVRDGLPFHSWYARCINICACVRGVGKGGVSSGSEDRPPPPIPQFEIFPT